MEPGGNQGGQFDLYVESELDSRVGFKWAKKSELDQIFFKNPILVFKLGLGFGHPLVLTFDQYGCPFACFTNRFYFLKFFLVSKVKQWFFFFEMLKLKE
jgi:hypothetical protein